MKRIKMKNGITIETPWMRVGEAAAYCSISRSMFTERAKGLHHAGDSRTRLYNFKLLDAWVNNELDIPFSSSKTFPPVRRRRISKSDEDLALIHPHTGKIYKTKEEDSV